MAETWEDFCDRITEEVDEFTMQLSNDEMEELLGTLEYNMHIRLEGMKRA